MSKIKKDKWTEEEITYLKLNYEKNGGKKLSSILTNHTYSSITKKASVLGLKVDMEIFSYDEKLIREYVIISFSIKEVLNRLGRVSSGAAYKYLNRFIQKKGIDISHFDSRKNNSDRSKKDINSHLLIGTNIGSSKLKEKLYREGFKKRECELCGQGEDWKGKKMSLILDHKNGVNNDNRIENLRIVCPNCNATLDTHCRGFKGKK